MPIRNVPQRFKYQAQMAAMFKCSFQSHNMLLVLWVGLFQFVEDLHFFETRAIPVTNVRAAIDSRGIDGHRLLAPHNLYGNLSVDLPSFALKHPRADNIRKHAFAKRGKDLVTSTVKLLTENDSIISFMVGG